MDWGFTDPVCVSWDPWVAKKLAIPFSAVLRDAALILRVLSRTLCPIGNGLCQLDILLYLYSHRVFGMRIL